VPLKTTPGRFPLSICKSTSGDTVKNNVRPAGGAGIWICPFCPFVSTNPVVWLMNVVMSILTAPVLLSLITSPTISKTQVDAVDAIGISKFYTAAIKHRCIAILGAA